MFQRRLCPRNIDFVSTGGGSPKFRVLGGGGGGTGVVFPGLRKYKVARATPKKADERGGGGGGTPTQFFSRTISGHHLHYWVRVPSVHNTDLRGDKQKKKKKKKKKRKFRGGLSPHLKFRGGGGTRPPPPPRFRRLCLYLM